MKRNTEIMKYRLLLLLFVFAFFVAKGQNKPLKHTVAQGETLHSIAQKYQLTIAEIEDWNPEVKDGLKFNMVLVLPNKMAAEKAVVATSNVLTHEVLQNETMYGICKKYGVTEEQLKELNPILVTEGVRIGQILTIPGKGKAVNVVSETVIYHEVASKETKYAIARKYGTTVEELERLNPEIVQTSLEIGQKIVVKKGAVVEKSVSPVAKLAVSVPVKEVVYVNYVVKPKETLYGLSKMAGISQDEMIRLNPFLKDGVVEGMVIKVPSSSSMGGAETNVKVQENVVKPVENVQKTLVLPKNNNGRKKITFLLPFNTDRIQLDSVGAVESRLKKDKFMQMTLDFYSGVMVAIDSVKQMGLPVDFKIYDSQETKTTTTAISTIRENKLDDSDVVIGPFYQANVEKVATYLPQTIVISPLSKEAGNGLSNIVQVVPNNALLKETLFDFMKQKNGNMLAIVDKKKESVRSYLQENQKQVRFVNLTESGMVMTDHFKSLLMKDRINFVIVETGNTAMIKSSMSAMMSALSQYKIQMVILDANETLQTDEINFDQLLKLKLTYASVTRDNISAEAGYYERNFRKKNKTSPNAFATKGFDLTMDAVMRLMQNGDYKSSLTNTTQQVENKFQYVERSEGGYANKGVYILNYDTDLIIKESN